MSYHTFRSWLTQGRKPNASQPLRDLVEAVDMAFDAGIGAKVDLIFAHGYDDWRALAWLLARQAPDQFGAVRTVKLGGDPDGVPLTTELKSTIDFSGWSLERLSAYIQLLEASGDVELAD